MDDVQHGGVVPEQLSEGIIVKGNTGLTFVPIKRSFLFYSRVQNINYRLI